MSPMSQGKKIGCERTTRTRWHSSHTCAWAGVCPAAIGVVTAVGRRGGQVQKYMYVKFFNPIGMASFSHRPIEERVTPCSHMHDWSTILIRSNLAPARP